MFSTTVTNASRKVIMYPMFAMRNKVKSFNFKQ